MRLPREISPGAARRRSFLADALGAIALAGGALIFCAGLGIVGVIALLTLLVVGPWYAIGGLARRRRRGRHAAAKAPEPQAELDSRLS